MSSSTRVAEFLDAFVKGINEVVDTCDDDK